MKRIEPKPWFDITKTFRGDLKMFPFYGPIDIVFMGTSRSMTGGAVSHYVFAYVENVKTKLLEL